MKNGSLLAVSMLGLMILGGCAGPKERALSLGGQDPNFRPKRVYAVNMNQAWDLTLKALNREGMIPEMVNRDTGVIQTGYQNLSAWERSKCDIRFSPEPQGKTYIYVRCRYEGRKEAAEPFRDFTYSSPQEAMKVEESVYRKLEPYILPFEGTASAREEAPARVRPRLAAAPAAEKAAPRPEAAASPQSGPIETISPAPVPPPAEPKAAAASLAVPAGAAEVKPPGPATAPPAAPKVEAAPPAPMAPPPRPEMKEEALSVPLVTAAPTNVRMAPSTRSKVVKVLPQGEKVEKIGESGNWTKVRLPSGEDVWVFSDFLQPSSAAGAAPVLVPQSGGKPPQPAFVSPKTSAAKPEIAPAKAKAAAPAKKAAVGGTPARLATKEITKMRAEPDAKSKVILVLKKGRHVEKLAESGPFCRVKLPWGDTGWVEARFLEPIP